MPILREVPPVPDVITSIGMIYGCGGALLGMGKTAGSTDITFTANRALFTPVAITRRVTIAKMGLPLSNVGTGNVDVGIYDKVGNRIVSIGSTAMSATGFSQAFDVTDTVLGPGIYYFAVVASIASTNIPVMSVTAGLASACGVLNMAAAGPPLPATATYVANTYAGVPIIYALQRTLV